MWKLIMQHWICSNEYNMLAGIRADASWSTDIACGTTRCLTCWHIRDTNSIIHQFKMHSHNPYTNELTQGTFLEAGLVIMHIILLGSWAQPPTLRQKNIADLSQRQIGTQGRHIGASPVIITDYQKCHPSYCDLAIWNEIIMWKCTCQGARDNWCADVCMAQRELQHTNQMRDIWVRTHEDH